MQTLIFSFLFFISFSALGQVSSGPEQKEFIYSYKERDHSLSETVLHLSFIYTLGWGVYLVQQKDTIDKHGSKETYKHNFGRFVFDNDEPIWNWTAHPYVGSQTYLFYRAVGHSRLEAFALSFIQSALFELTTEVLTEPISIQDLYQTPVLGVCLGVALEKASLWLLNSGYQSAKILGHLLNPSTLFWFYEGQVQVIPTLDLVNKDGRQNMGLQINASF